MDMQLLTVDTAATALYNEHQWSVRLEVLEENWKSFTTNHLVLQRFASDNQDRDYFKRRLYDATLESFLETKAHILGKLKALETPVQPALNAPLHMPQPRSSQTALEAIKLPKFKGLQVDWETFKEQFTALVIEDANMPPIVKFQRLLNCLKDEAQRTVQGIKVVADNFVTALLCGLLCILLNMPLSNKESAAHLSLLLSNITESINNFTALGRPVQYWDDMLNFFITNKLSERTRMDWIRYIATEKLGDFPTHKQLETFLAQRVRSLDLAQSSTEPNLNKLQPTNSNDVPKQRAPKHHGKASSTVSYHNGSRKGKVRKATGCSCCKGNHFVAFCSSFLQLPSQEKKKLVDINNLCSNCFNSHPIERCYSTGRCRQCGEKHHSKLHELYSGTNTDGVHSGNGCQLTAKNGNSNSTQASSVYCSMEQNSELMPSTTSLFVRRKGFLATAILTFRSPRGHRMRVRALLDTCSEDSFFSEHMVQTLSLDRQRASVICYGVGEGTTSVAHALSTAHLYSEAFPEFSLEVSGLVLKKVAGNTPYKWLDTAPWHHLKGLNLADPAFNVPARVDCILGTQVFAAILRDRIKKGLPDQPGALETIFGWVVFGAEPSIAKRSSPTRVLHTVTDSAEAAGLLQALTKFWETEEVPSAPCMSPEEQACYDHFKETHFRNSEGRFVLRLPFKETPSCPDSKVVAEACLTRQLRRFSKTPQTGVLYSAFMQEYADLQHMQLVPRDEVNNANSCYIPHHGVFKRDSGKIRIVFNASQSYSNGRSLNSFLHIGPKLQEDVLIVTLRWTFFPVVFTCDVVKMFRQFIIHQEDRDWQRILWRPSFNDDLQVFRLNTVTYGEGCAPFQSNACMLQLADDGEAKFPKAAAALRQGRYADDFYTEEDSIEAACESSNQLIQLLSSAGMEAGKWAANREEILPRVQMSESQVVINVPQEQEVISTLGLRWLPSEDVFSFKVSSSPTLPKIISKRFLLSQISKLYDPLGFLSPVVTRGKILLQSLWLLKLGWDDPVPVEIQEAWTLFYNQLLDLECLKIQRWLGTFSFSGWDLHCFCDASKRAYATVLYVVTSTGQTFSSKLLVAKSKVAPIKVVSVPKLELCAATLLAKLVSYVLKNLKRKPSRVFCWSDSKVVIAWLQSHPSRWKTFVANRVSSITASLPDDTIWGYVSTSENPADLPTRGLIPLELKDSSLWWHGPTWLTQPSSQWPQYTEKFSSNEEMSPEQTHIFVSQELELMTWIESFSSIDKIIRILAYIHRWRTNSKLPRAERRVRGPCASEIKAGFVYLLRIVQKTFFRTEIQCLSQGRKIPSNSVILRLSPTLDCNGLMRVGGRLQNSFLTQDEKHPIVLPTHNHASRLLVAQAHMQTLHGGPSVVQSHLSRRFWLVRGRNYIRKIVHDCVNCARYRGAVFQQQMAPLPAVRTRPARPFTYTGVDYAGPFLVRCAPGRGQRAYKAYVAIFVCMVTRAAHIEVVSDLTTAAFLAAFRRFVARRGLPHTMHSDNGTTFKGADEELYQLFRQTSSFSEEVAASIAKDGVTWSFIPPRAPHFGGLWETNVRSFKKHLHRVIGSNKLTYEEFSTLSCTIEACLNSRPLSPLSSNEEDLAALTPGHFLIGAALTSAPEPFDDTNETVSAHSRWHLLSLMRNHFWKPWKTEFLSQMQQRSKWLYPNQIYKVGDLVLFKDPQLPPSKWPLARIIRLHVGADQLSRVAVIKTATKEYTRALNQLVRLPINTEAQACLSSSEDVTVGGTDTPALDPSHVQKK